MRDSGCASEMVFYSFTFPFLFERTRFTREKNESSQVSLNEHKFHWRQILINRTVISFVDSIINEKEKQYEHLQFRFCI